MSVDLEGRVYALEQAFARALGVDVKQFHPDAASAEPGTAVANLAEATIEFPAAAPAEDEEPAPAEDAAPEADSPAEDAPEPDKA